MLAIARAVYCAVRPDRRVVGMPGLGTLRADQLANGCTNHPASRRLSRPRHDRRVTISEAGHMPTRGLALDPHALAALSDLVGDDPEAITEIVEAFLEDAPDRLAEIRTGLAGDDLELVRRAAHTLKANGLTFGAQEFATASRGARANGEAR